MDFEKMFPDKRETGSTPLHQCQLVMTRMFQIFDFLCRKYQIEYFLTGGTLLGAIRYEGFMPFDDDVDVGLTRSHFEKFMQYAAHELPGDIFLQTPQTDKFYGNYGRLEAKLRDNYSSYNLEGRHHNGLQVDIFVYDKAFLPNNRLIYYTNRTIYHLHNFVSATSKRLQRLGLVKEKGLEYNQFRTMILKWVSRYIPMPFVYSSSYLSFKNMVDSPGDYIKGSELAGLSEVKFEGITAYVPIGWDACLRRQFGDYTKIVPDSRRKSKHSFGAPNAIKPCSHYASLQWAKNRRLPAYQNIS